MVEIGPEEFMRALAYARAVKMARPREDLFTHLVSRLGEMIFRQEARRALPVAHVGELNWIALPKHVDDIGVDLRIRGWKVDVKTPSAAMQLDWPACKKSDLFPKVSLDKACLAELAARYKNPKRSTPVGLLADPIPRITGEFVGWIGIGSAEKLAGDDASLRVADELASPQSLWALLKAKAGPDIKLADDAWQKGREVVPAKASRPRRIAAKPAAVLLPPRRAARRKAA